MNELSANTPSMRSKAQQALRNALALSPKARADIAGTLLRSLDATEDAGVDAAWAAEIGSTRSNPARRSWFPGSRSGGASTRRRAVAERSVRFHPEAECDLEEGLRFYLSRSAIAGERFLAEVGSALALLQETPERWPIFHLDTRRLRAASGRLW